LGVTEFLFEISRIVFSANFLRTVDDFVHFWEKRKIKQTSNVKLFFKNFERMCKLMKEEKLANKNWGSPNSFKSYLENKQKNKRNIGQIEQIIERALESRNLVQGFY